jgi:hypothetical protein
MGVRFRRSLTILPGIRLNFSKSGVSLSLGRRGASITLGSRGTFANVGLPGTGLSYRTKLDVAKILRNASAEPMPRAYTIPDRPAVQPERTFEQCLRDILKDRERGAIDWDERALGLATQAPPESDEDAFEAFSRKIAAGRFARRMVEGDRTAWAEVVREELVNEELPFGFSFEWGIEDPSERIYIGVELPGEDLIGLTSLPTMKMRELHEDTCCALLLRVAHEVLRVVPKADELYLVGYMPGVDPATGQPRRDIYLRLATDRASFLELNLDQVDPSAAFELLGGIGKRRRAQLQPIGAQPIES